MYSTVRVELSTGVEIGVCIVCRFQTRLQRDATTVAPTSRQKAKEERKRTAA